MSEQTSRLVAASQRLRAWRNELTAAQTAAIQAVDDARRADEISPDEAVEIEAVIRRGHPYGARKRLADARRRHRQAPP
ncbi:MAG: hypothetical protein GEV07_05340 [Streptosporangiales bacterium]|nr:hypothetical protein [Streptosporangiales bacterium]